MCAGTTVVMYVNVDVSVCDNVVVGVDVCVDTDCDSIVWYNVVSCCV